MQIFKHCIAVMVTVKTEIFTSLSSFWISRSSFLRVQHLIFQVPFLGDSFLGESSESL